MGIGRWFKETFSQSSEPVTFSESPPEPIDALFRRLNNSDGFLMTVTREEALSVPAVLRGRNMLCSIATLPLVQYDAQMRTVVSPFLRQLERSRTNVVVLSLTVEDLLFEKVAYWRITEAFADGYPAYIERVDPSRVTENEERGVIVLRIDGKRVDWSEVIKFESPNPGILQGAGGRTIRRALLLEQMASVYADNPRPLDYFTPKVDGGDPGENEDVEATIDSWREARRKRGTGYVPGWLEYRTVDTPTPAELQLIEQQKQATLDISNLVGIDPEDVGVSTTSRTYQNAVDRRQDRVNDVLLALMMAITERLSMPDVTKNGYSVEFDLNARLRPDPKTRAEIQLMYLAQNVITREEIRMDEKKGPLPAELLNQPTRPVIQASATVGQPVPEIGAA
ncbi:phage portal protein [Micromonospora arida]